MANTMGIDFVGDIREAAADLPSTLVFGSVTITGTRGAYTKTKETEAGPFGSGNLMPTGFSWSGAVADFTAGLPDMGETVTIDGTKYYVETQIVNEDQDVVRLDVNRN